MYILIYEINVVLEMGQTCPLVGTVGQVAGAVIALAAFDGIS
jgi:flagellar motor component MotA